MLLVPRNALFAVSAQSSLNINMIDAHGVVAIFLKVVLKDSTSGSQWYVYPLNIDTNVGSQVVDFCQMQSLLKKITKWKENGDDKKIYQDQ